MTSASDDNDISDRAAEQPVTQEAPNPATAEPCKPRTALIVIIATMLGLLAGTAAGAVTAKLTAPQPHGPSAPPAIATKFPTAASLYLPDITVSLIAQAWLEKSNGWACKTETRHNPLSGAQQMTACHPPNNIDMRVYVEHDQDAKVRAVHAHCGYPPGHKGCRSLFAGLADTSLTGQPDLRKQGEDWATQNVDRDNTTVIGKLRYLITLDPHQMRVLPAE